MKYIIGFVVAALLLVGTGYWVYTNVLESDHTVESSEVEDLEMIRPTNMRISEVTDTSFTVEWKTREAVSGYVKYGPTSSSINLMAQDERGTSPSKRHKVMVSGLSRGQKYYFIVMSDEIAFGRDGVPMEVLTIGE